MSIDKELLLWRGKLSFKQYISSKILRYGIKLFSLCDESGYLCNSYVYLGKDTNISDVEKLLEALLGKTGAVISKLMKDLFNCGYKFYIDNWYSSADLFRYEGKWNSSYWYCMTEPYQMSSSRIICKM